MIGKKSKTVWGPRPEISVNLYTSLMKWFLLIRLLIVLTSDKVLIRMSKLRFVKVIFENLLLAVKTSSDVQVISSLILRKYFRTLQLRKREVLNLEGKLSSLRVPMV